MWFIQKITKLRFREPNLLPSADFVLTDGTNIKKVRGWLPCHHANVGYDLKLSGTRIQEVVNLTINEKKNQKMKIITQTAHKLAKQKGFGPKNYSDEEYKKQAMQAYQSDALWVCTVLYSHWEMRNMDIRRIYEILAEDIEKLIQPDSPASFPRYIFQPLFKTKVLIQRALQKMGKLPYEDWEGFEARRKWQIRMQSDTGARKKPSDHILQLERYQDLWTTSYHIREAKLVRSTFRPDNVTLIIGSPHPSIVPNDAVVLVRNLEDAYRWKCEVDHGSLFLITIRENENRLTELGVSDVNVLQPGKAIHLPWAHLWGMSDWLKLVECRPEHVTCIGRLDQWPLGRGQVFRDMLAAKSFDTSRGYHAAVDNVRMMHTDDIKAFVAKVQRQHGVVQCFSDEAHDDIDCGRRFLTKPRRIRTLRPVSDTDLPANCQALYEECRIHAPDRVDGNASVQSVRTYKGLKVPAAIYLCSEHTTPFDVHAARTFCRDVLYVLNCSTCLFSMKKEAPNKCTINPFI